MQRCLAIFLLCLPLIGHAELEQPLIIFVSIPPQQYLVQRIGADRVQVNVMLKPGQTPETYDPGPKQIALLAAAQIYFRIGVPFERHWMPMLAAQNKTMLVVDCCTQLVKDGDPHIWTDPNNAKIIAGQIKDILSDRDPDGAPFYGANYQSLIVDLDRLDRDIHALLQQRRTDYFIVSHGGWKYFADAYGLRQMALDAYGREKGPRGLAEMVDLAKREDINKIFIQTQHPSGTAYTLAKEIHAQAVLIDNLNENYIDNLYKVSRLIAEAVR
ncbi:MAG: hypothetical protein HW386_2190 [Gammaproteobacteria bacterium]|nr:hypothetical protein [Gammaproteobacteria bacterium]